MASSPATEVPVVSPRTPCPCGSKKRYKLCHGKIAKAAANVMVKRPFEGLPEERGLVAIRQLISAATITYRLTPELAKETKTETVIAASALPAGLPALRRADGVVMLGLQSIVPGTDLSAGFAAALRLALDAEAGTAIETVPLADVTATRLQDMLDLTAEATLELQETFDFWLDSTLDVTEDVEGSLKSANELIFPTREVPGVDHAFWVDVSTRQHVRWLLDMDEDDLTKALARLHAKSQDTIGEGTKFAGFFRADGIVIPVWDLPEGVSAEDTAVPMQAFVQRFNAALAVTDPLNEDERRARAGIVSRQVTLR